MKICFLILLLALMGLGANNAFPQSGTILPDCSRCKDGEKLPDVNSCSQYYLCLGGKSLPQRCARGLYYDVLSGLCNRAFLVDCALNRLGQSAHDIVDSMPNFDLETDTRNDERSPHFAIHTNAPPCNKDKTLTTTPCTTTTTPCKTTRKSTTTTCTTTTTKCPQSSAILPDCSPYEDGETLPDVNSCSQYYLCVGGKSLPQRCARGLYYDVMSGLCNRAFLVDCALNRLGQSARDIVDSMPNFDLETDTRNDKRSPHFAIHTNAPPCNKDKTLTTTPCTTTTTPCKTTTKSTTTCTTTTTKCPQSSAIIPDCSRYEDGETLPDVNSCSQYYLCVGGKSLPQRCARGLYYDVMSGLCNRAFLVDCALNRLGQSARDIVDSMPNFDLGTDTRNDERSPHFAIHTNAPPCNKDKTLTTTPCTTTTTPCKITTKSTTTTCASRTTKCTATTPTTSCKTTRPTKITRTITKPTTKNCRTTKPTTTCTTTKCSTTTSCKTTKKVTTTCSTKRTTPRSTKAPCSSTKAPCSRTTTVCATTAHHTDLDENTPRCFSSSKDCRSLRDGTILLDYSHCSRFYVCTNQRAIHQRCRPGYWIDQDTLSCLPRSSVKNCAGRRNYCKLLRLAN